MSRLPPYRQAFLGVVLTPLWTMPLTFFRTLHAVSVLKMLT